MSTTVSYKNNTLTTVDNETKILSTAGKYMEDDITLVDTTSGGAEVLVVDTPDAAGGTIREITVTESVKLQGQKEVTLTSSPQTVTPDTGYEGFRSLIVKFPSVGGAIYQDEYGYLVLSDEGTPRCIPSDVTFYDYDGTPLYSYTASEFQELSELPPNPIHDGLTSQGWNWTLTDAKTQALSAGAVDIAQIYIPTDEKTHIFIAIPNHIPSDRRVIDLRFGQSAANSVTVNWGDGTEETIAATAMGYHRHTYINGGNYEITLDVANGKTLNWNTTSGQSFLGQPNSTESAYNLSRTWIKKIHLGKGFTSLGTQNNFSSLQDMREFTIPNGVVSAGSTNIASNPSLKFVAFPSGFTSLGEYCLQQTYSMTAVSFPKSLTTMSTNALRQTYSLQRVVIPPNITSITNSLFYRANAISKIVIPPTVTSIGTEAFYQCYGLREVHLQRETPPTLSNTNAFATTASDCIFYVPYSADHSILEAYQSATNWSSFSSRIQEEQTEVS